MATAPPTTPSTAAPANASSKPEEVWTFVGEDMKVDGALTTGSPLSIAGEIVGAVTSARDIEVAEDAIVRGSITGHDVVVAGTVHGPVNANGQLFILASGSVTGDISVRSILIEEGGTLAGRCNMTS